MTEDEIENTLQEIHDAKNLIGIAYKILMRIAKGPGVSQHIESATITLGQSELMLVLVEGEFEKLMSEFNC